MAFAFGNDPRFGRGSNEPPVDGKKWTYWKRRGPNYTKEQSFDAIDELNNIDIFKEIYVESKRDSTPGKQLCVFRSGIKPNVNDPLNRNGCHFYRNRGKMTTSYDQMDTYKEFVEHVRRLIEGQLGDTDPPLINGIMLDIRDNLVRLEIWFREQEPIEIVKRIQLEFLEKHHFHGSTRYVQHVNGRFVRPTEPGFKVLCPANPRWWV